jgi:hypothetical protein
MRRLDLLEELVELQIVPEVGVSVAVRHDMNVSMTVCGSIKTLRDVQLGVATVESPSTFLILAKDVNDLESGTGKS